MTKSLDSSLETGAQRARNVRELAAAIALLVVVVAAILALIPLPKRVSTAEAAIKTLEGQYQVVHKLLLYQVCTTDPPPNPRELYALEVDCSELWELVDSRPWPGPSPSP